MSVQPVNILAPSPVVVGVALLSWVAASYRLVTAVRTARRG
jgi:hypothetical protein